jgi:hypothetical protein
LSIIHIKSKHIKTNIKISLALPESSVKIRANGSKTIKTGKRIFAFNLNSCIMIYIKMTLSYLRRQTSESPGSHKIKIKHRKAIMEEIVE